MIDVCSTIVLLHRYPRLLAGCNQLSRGRPQLLPSQCTAFKDRVCALRLIFNWQASNDLTECSCMDTVLVTVVSLADSAYFREYPEKQQ